LYLKKLTEQGNKCLAFKLLIISLIIIILYLIGENNEVKGKRSKRIHSENTDGKWFIQYYIKKKP
jgi:hypothetical protein